MILKHVTMGKKLSEVSVNTQMPPGKLQPEAGPGL